MGYAIRALPLGVRNVRENPRLIAISYGLLIAMIPLGIVGGLLMLVLSFVPVVGPVVARVVVGIPLKILLLGGMVGVAGAGFAGGVTVGDYVDSVRDNFKSLFGAFALYEAAILSITVAIAVLALFVFGFGALLSSPTSGASMPMAGFGLGVLALYVGALVLLLSLAIVFQFLDVAVVLGDHGAVDALKESWRLTGEAPLSVFGYTIVRALLGAVILLPGYVLAVAGGAVSDVLTWAGLALVVVLYPVAFAVIMSYHAAYYGVRLKAA